MRCCHLHCHSSNSHFDGLPPVDELAAAAARLGHPGLALTDHGNVFGAARFFEACEQEGVKGMIGMEAYEAVPHTWELERDLPILSRPWDGDPRYHHVTLWAKDLTGWRNLCRLHTRSFTAEFKPKNQPLLDRATIELHNEGLMVGLGCIASKTNQALIRSGPDDAYETAKWYAEVFGDRAYVEVMANLPEQQALLREQRRIAQRLGLQTIATNDVHYIDREDGKEGGTHHILVQARAYRKKDVEQSTDKSDSGYGQWYGADEFFFKSGDEMLATGGLLAEEIDRTVDVLERCDFDFNALDKPEPPTAPVPAPGEDKDFDAWLDAEGPKWYT